MKDVAVVAYCRTGIARATRGALNQTHGIPMTAHVLRQASATWGSTLLELGRRGGRRAVVGVCTAGGMSTAAYLERA